MHEWLAQARARLAASTGDDESTYDLGNDEIEKLLDLARIAAHDSADRTNAPLISYLVGVAHSRHPDQKLADLVRAATGPSD